MTTKPISKYATDKPLFSAPTADDDPEELHKRANFYLGWGGGFGAVTAASLALLGGSCPLCIVAVPTFVAYGSWCKKKARDNERAQHEDKR
jgi:hypothetical protein